MIARDDLARVICDHVCSKLAPRTDAVCVDCERAADAVIREWLPGQVAEAWDEGYEAAGETNPHVDRDENPYLADRGGFVPLTTPPPEGSLVRIRTDDGDELWGVAGPAVALQTDGPWEFTVTPHADA